MGREDQLGGEHAIRVEPDETSLGTPDNRRARNGDRPWLKTSWTNWARSTIW